MIGFILDGWETGLSSTKTPPKYMYKLSDTLTREVVSYLLCF